MTTPQPYVPQAPVSTLRMFYRSVGQVLRLVPVLSAGAMSVSWQPLSAVIDPHVGIPGQLGCRLDLQFVRPGKDQPAPIAAGRAPDRVGLLYFDLSTDLHGIPLVLAGDRLQMVSGPVFGTFEIRVIPDVAQDLLGAHHVEVQVIEVAQSLQPGSLTPFPGSPA